MDAGEERLKAGSMRFNNDHKQARGQKVIKMAAALATASAFLPRQ